MALGERKIQHLPARAYQAGGLKVNVWYGKSMVAQRAGPFAESSSSNVLLGYFGDDFTGCRVD
jgi:hypothetical protein